MSDLGHKPRESWNGSSRLPLGARAGWRGAIAGAHGEGVSADRNDILYLFYPETEAARAAGLEHFDRISTRLAEGGPAISEAAAQGMLTAVGALLAVPFDQVVAELEAIKQPVLYANGLNDVMIPAHNSYAAVQHLDNATLVLYTGAGHAFLFQYAKAFTKQVADFLAD
ncbi:alpha/beta hydrolase [Streptomyces sp. NPDC007251]|uniref:alpha/beta fold hydrolase n=1 Tax=Streptomyces sp. NPDC007251 TaxID=3154483 RepID=UPI0033FC7F8E